MLLISSIWFEKKAPATSIEDSGCVCKGYITNEDESIFLSQ